MPLNTPTGSLMARILHLGEHDNNLSYQFFRECVFWNKSYEAGNLENRLTGAIPAPPVLSQTVAQFTEENGRIPRVLDLGCGPLPTSAYLHHSGAADVVAVDVLANSYLELFESWEREPIMDLNEGCGENVLARFGLFDITFISNALDHTQCPPLTWLNLYQATRVGGYIVHVHGVREATFHRGEQLHHFDLYPEGDHLSFENMMHESICLTSSMAVTPLGGKVIDVGKADHDWFFQSFRKDADTPPDAELLLFIIGQLQREFLDLQSWRGRLEGFMNNLIGFERGGLAYSARQHKALVDMTTTDVKEFRGKRGRKVPNRTKVVAATE